MGKLTIVKSSIICTNAATLRGQIAPLYHRHSSKQRPQDAYIEIYPDLRRAWAEWDSGLEGLDYHDAVRRATRMAGHSRL